MNLLFAQPWMLLWAAAALIPLILFLLRRRTAQTIQWGAMQFLQTASRGPAPRPPLRRLLLLLTRMAIPIVVALVAATPGCQEPTDGAGDSFHGPRATHYVFVFDLSASMGPRANSETESPVQQSIEYALQQLSAAQQGDRFSVITSGAGKPAEKILAATADRDRAGNILRNLPSGYGVFQPRPVTNAVAELIGQISPQVADHQIIIQSDFATADWSDEVVESLATIDELATTNSRTAFQLIDRSNIPRSNLAITELGAIPTSVTVGQTVVVEVSARVLGRSSPGPGNTVVPRTKNVELIVDGVPLASQPLTVIGNDVGTIAFDVPIERSGNIPVTARFDGFGLAADDQRFLVIDARKALRMLVVNGTTQSPNSLVTALSDTDVSDTPAIELATIEPSQLVTARLDRIDVVALTGIDSMDESQRGKLVEYVHGGGKLLISPGEIFDRATWQHLLDDLGAAIQITDGVRQGNFGFDPLEYEHPAVNAFREFPEAGLLDVPVYQYHPTRLTSPAVERILNFNDGQAAIVTFAAGQGRVVLTTTPLVAADPDSPWNNLPAWWSYVPLVNELVFWLFGSDDLNRSRVLGERLVVESGAFQLASRMEVRHSSGEVITASREIDTIIVDPHQVTEPGFVEINRDPGTGLSGESMLFAFNVDSRESDPWSIDADALQSRLNQELSSVAYEPASFREAPDRTPWQICLIMLLILLVIEWALASRTGIFGSRREAS